MVPTFHIDQSDYLIAFGADFLETWISPVEYAKKFASMRTLKEGARGSFVYIRPRVSMTAANADRRIIVPPGASREIAEAITSDDDTRINEAANKFGINPVQLRSIAVDLAGAKRPLALPGTNPDAAFAASLINSKRAASLVDTERPHALTRTAASADLTSLVDDIDKGDVDVLVILRANQAYAMPAASGFLQALERVPSVISLSSFMDETTAKADWVLPSNTPLESWGDYAPYADVRNLMQPTMGTLFDTKQAGDILIGLLKEAGLEPGKVLGAESFYGYLRRAWEGSDWEGLVQRGGDWGEHAAGPQAL